MAKFRSLVRLTSLSGVLLGALAVVAACEGVDTSGALNLADSGVDGYSPNSDSATPPSPSSHVVKGTIVGLKGSGLVLRNNGKDDIAPKATDTTFAFATQIATGSPYAVTVATQPSAPFQQCTVSKGEGTVSGDVTDVLVTCVDAAFYAIGGTITGLVGSGLVLQNNGGDNLAITTGDAGTATFTFPTKVASGQPFAVTVLSSPEDPWQTCTLSGAAGTVVSGDVNTVAVNCSLNTYTVGGTTSGLAGSGLTLSLKDDNGDTLSADAAVNANGSFSFATPVKSGVHYNVTVASDPSNPSQTCTVGQGSDTVAGANVTSVTVDCTTNNYAVGGTVAGLRSGTVVLQNGGEEVTVDKDGTFSFPTKVASNGTYAVTVKTQPNDSTCTVTSDTGTVTNGDVTSVTVTCDYACAGYKALKGCWYTSDLSQSCNTVCTSHGGFDAVHAKHTGNPICTHFYPEKAEGTDWVTIECCSTDNNTRWGANGDTPDPNYSHGACHLACACNE